MAKGNDKPSSGPLGSRTERPHDKDGWDSRKPSAEPTGDRKDSPGGFPAGGAPGRHK
jgi:hypothetical protein